MPVAITFYRYYNVFIKNFVTFRIFADYLTEKLKGVRILSKNKHANALFRQCYDEYRSKLFAYCLSRLEGSRENADDCVQETFIVFYNRLLDGENFENPRAFLYRTADNFVKREKEKNAKDLRRLVPLDSVRQTAVDDEFLSHLDRIDYDECAKKLISLLDEEEKKLYGMRYIQKMSVEQVAEVLGISRPAASMRLMRLRKKVMDMVYSYTEGEGGR